MDPYVNTECPNMKNDSFKVESNMYTI